MQVGPNLGREVHQEVQLQMTFSLQSRGRERCGRLRDDFFISVEMVRGLSIVCGVAFAFVADAG
jgi:hypothetical protein